MLRSETADRRRNRGMADSSSRSSPNDLILRPRILHGPLHEPLSPQIRKTGVNFINVLRMPFHMQVLCAAFL